MVDSDCSRTCVLCEHSQDFKLNFSRVHGTCMQHQAFLHVGQNVMCGHCSLEIAILTFSQVQKLSCQSCARLTADHFSLCPHVYCLACATLLKFECLLCLNEPNTSTCPSMSESTQTSTGILTTFSGNHPLGSSSLKQARPPVIPTISSSQKLTPECRREDFSKPPEQCLTCNSKEAKSRRCPHSLCDECMPPTCPFCSQEKALLLRIKCLKCSSTVCKFKKNKIVKCLSCKLKFCGICNTPDRSLIKHDCRVSSIDEIGAVRLRIQKFQPVLQREKRTLDICMNCLRVHKINSKKHRCSKSKFSLTRLFS